MKAYALIKQSNFFGGHHKNDRHIATDHIYSSYEKAKEALKSLPQDKDELVYYTDNILELDIK